MCAIVVTAGAFPTNLDFAAAESATQRVRRADCRNLSVDDKRHSVANDLGRRHVVRGDHRCDPKLLPPPDALFELPFRIMPRGNQLVIDTSILGDERGAGGLSTSGLPSSNDSSTANIRLAIPTRGGVSASMRIEKDQVLPFN